jgi:hypothetical protein
VTLVKLTTIGGYVSQHKTIILPSQFSTCHAYSYDPRGNYILGDVMMNREPSMVAHMRANQSHACTSWLPITKD